MQKNIRTIAVNENITVYKKQVSSAFKQKTRNHNSTKYKLQKVCKFTVFTIKVYY